MNFRQYVMCKNKFLQPLVGALLLVFGSQQAWATVCPADYNAARNEYGGFYNAPSYPAVRAFAALKDDGRISAWGGESYGGTGAPTDSGYVSISSNRYSFAALKADGSIRAWGHASYGGSGAPTDNGYTSISSNSNAFAALKNDGSISVWGDPGSGGIGAPISNDAVAVSSTGSAFAALNADGSIHAWGNANNGGADAPTDDGYASISSNVGAFAALKSDGSINVWGDSNAGGTGSPTETGFSAITSAYRAFAALHLDGSIRVWGDPATGGDGAPTDTGYIAITSNGNAFAALRSDGSISAWGRSDRGGEGAPSGPGYVSISAGTYGFASLRADGRISEWVSADHSGSYAPTDDGYVSISSGGNGYAALKSDGTISSWNMSYSYDRVRAPTDDGYVSISTNGESFAALKADGSISAWGVSRYGGSGAPTDAGYVSINNRSPTVDPDCPTGIWLSGTIVTRAEVETDQGALFSYTLPSSGGPGEGTARAAWELPDWLSFDAATNTLSGTPSNEHVGTTAVTVQSIDAGGDLVLEKVVIAVNNVNDPPQSSSVLPSLYARRQASFSFTVPPETFEDPDTGDSLSLSVVDPPQWLTIDADTGVLSGTPDISDAGVHIVNVRATDGSNAFVDQPITITVPAFDTCPTDYDAASNRYQGKYNAPFSPALRAFAALRNDGRISVWGDPAYGGTGAPDDPGFVSIASSSSAFAALKADGAISAWGDSTEGGTGAPTDNGYVSISSTIKAFAALKADGSIRAWGDAFQGGAGAPAESGYTSISSNGFAFAALKGDGSISAWPLGGLGGELGGRGAPADSGYVSIASSAFAFAALNADGHISVWGRENAGGTGAPTDDGYVSISSTEQAFAALKADGSISAWGSEYGGGTGAPTDSEYVSISSTSSAFAAVKVDGSITTWGNASGGGSDAPTDGGYVSISSTRSAFAALKANGSLHSWGDARYGGNTTLSSDYYLGSATYVSVTSNDYAFAALRSDGTIRSWGNAQFGADGAPADAGYVSISSNSRAFAALKSDGTIHTWGDVDSGGVGAPTSDGFVSVNNRSLNAESNCIDSNTRPIVDTITLELRANEDQPFNYLVPPDTFTDADAGDTLTLSVQDLPTWLSFNATTGALSGTPDQADVGVLSFTLFAADSSGENVEQTVRLAVADVNDAPMLAAAIADQSAVQDIGFSFTVPEDTFTDPDATDTLTYVTEDLPDWLQFNAATATFSGTPGNVHVGTASVTLRALDENGEQARDKFDISVIDINDAPQVETSLSDINLEEDAMWRYAVLASAFADPDIGDNLTLEVFGLPDWLSFDHDTLALSGQPTQDDVGAYTVQVRATDIGGLAAEQSFDLIVTDVNDTAPVFDSAEAIEVPETVSGVVHTLSASDADRDDTVRYTASGYDAGHFEINETTGEIRPARPFDFESPVDADADNVYRLNVTAWDVAGHATSQTLDIRVTDVDEAAVVPVQSLQVDEDAEIGTAVGTLTGQDPEGSELDWHLLSENSPFLLEASGLLRVADSLDFESDADFVLSVEADDGTFKTPAAVQVYVIDASADRVSVWLQMMQGGQPVQQIQPDDALVVVTANIANPVPGRNVNYGWGGSSSNLLDRLTAADITSEAVTFSPTGLSVGDKLVARVNVVRDGVSSQAELVLPVASVNAPVEQIIDSDGDGIPDVAEGDLNAGVDMEASNRLQTRRGDDLSHVMESEVGTVLRLGRVARAAKRDQALVSAEDLVSHLSAVTLAMVTDVLNEERLDSHDAVFDYEVANLSEGGASVQVVLPLRMPLAADSQYMKFDPATGWRAFAVDTDNSIRSAPWLAGYEGQCPAPGGEIWSYGLSEKHSCIELRIKDGGVNDGDSYDEEGVYLAGRGVNGTVEDLGAVIYQTTEDTPSVAHGQSSPPTGVDNEDAVIREPSSGGGKIGVLFLLMLMGVVAYRRDVGV